MRLEGRTAIVIGAGQAPGETIGNGRATAMTFAREGAHVVAADLVRERAEETAAAIVDAGGEAVAVELDANDEAAVADCVASTVGRRRTLDVLHCNVGVSLGGGDARITDITTEAFDRLVGINLRSMVLALKHVLPIMREQRRGSITTVSSIAAVTDYPYITYKTTKAGVIALTRQAAIENAPFGIRANVIIPGQLNTPMAVDNRIGVIGATREEVIAVRDAQVPLLGRMGTAWDVANAALFLNSDEAAFITGLEMVVDGGQTLKIG